MLVRPSEYVRPTDGPYAFPLRAVGEDGFTPFIKPLGEQRHVTETAQQVMSPEACARFEARIHRWEGPQDVDADGARPFQAQQLLIEETAWCRRLEMAHVRRVLEGTALVLRSPSGVVDYVLRDHHMLDVVLHHYASTGRLPTAIFHADRHSDWCDDRYLHARVPAQAATWWALLHGLKRPGGLPVLREQDIHFATAQADVAAMSGRNIGASVRVPGFLDPSSLGWEDALERVGDASMDWVSLDLDYFQPAPQLRLVRGLIREPRFQAMLANAEVRVFVLSPQFTNGGDRHEDWTIQGRLHSTLRLLNLLRGG